MKNNYFSRCVLLAGLCSVIMVFAVTPVYATGGAFSPLPHAVSEGDITVTGKVVDDAGEPLIGVSIQVKGTSKGATTEYSIRFYPCILIYRNEDHSTESDERR